MRISILACLLIAGAWVGSLCADEPTRLTYFVEYEQEQEEDYIEISLTVKSQQQSLVEAISNAGRVASQVATLANNYCKDNSKKAKGDCKEAVEVSKFDIDPKYQMVRKQATFSVSHDITIKVFNTDNIGYLVDPLLKLEELTIGEFSWKPLEDKDFEEEAIKQGLEQGEGLCEQAGLSLGKIINIQQIVEEEKEEKGGDEEQGQEEEEQQPQVTVYKFEVECVPQAKGKSK